MKYKDIQDLTIQELRKKQASMKEELFMARMKNSLGQLGNPVQIRGLRRDIARVNTALARKAAH